MVVDLEEDIGWFIDRYFSQDDHRSVHDVLEAGVFRTPRVARAVLFLSNGSLILLRHYARACVLDVRSVLLHAEYIAGDSEVPIQVRDMSLPLWHERNRGSDDLSERTLVNPGGGTNQTPRGPRSADRNTHHHAHLVNSCFTLGKVHYLVATKQPNSNRVRCFRKARTVVTLVELPLAFVLEQVAERIEITDTTY